MVISVQATTMETQINIDSMDISKIENKYAVNRNLNAESEHLKEVEYLKNSTYEQEDCEVQENRKNSLISAQNNGYFFCNECDKKYGSTTALRIHTSSVHEGISFECDKCDYKATQKGHLKNHARAVHDGIRYPCSQCDFTATFKHNITQHVKKNH